MPNKDLFSKAEVTRRVDLDIQFNVPYGEGIEPLASKFTVRYRDDLRSIAEIMELGVEMASKAIVPYARFLAGMAEIPINTTMDILMNVIQPPMMDLNLGVVKDAFVRESYPTMNYGDRHILISGADYDGKYITYLGFDISNINSLEGMVIQDIHLIIQKEFGTGGTISFHECRNDWYENYVIWYHDMKIDPNPIFTVEAGQDDGYIIQNLTELITQKVALGITKFSLAVKTDDYVVFSAKESGAGPRIVVTYFDPEWFGYSDRIQMYNHALIRRLEAHDFESAALITKKLVQTCKAYVIRRENLVSKASIINMQIPSTAMIVRSLYNTNRGFVQGRLELGGKAYIPKSSIDGKGDIKQVKDLSSKAHVKYEAESRSMEGRAGIVKDFMESVAILKHFRDLASMARIGDTRTELPSQASIMNTLLFNKADIRKTRDIASKATIIANKDFVAKADITKAFFPGKGFINETEDLFSKADILGGKDLFSTANIVKGHSVDIPNKTHVREREDFEGTVNIHKLLETESFADITNFINLGTAVIKHLTEMYAKATIVPNMDLAGRAEIAQIVQLTSQAMIRQFDQIDLTSQAFIGYYIDAIRGRAEITNCTFDCVAYILQPRKWRPNREGGLTFEDRRLPRPWPIL